LVARIGDPTNGVISPDGCLVIPGNFVRLSGANDDRPVSDLTIRVNELASGKEMVSFVGCADQVTAMALAPDGRTVATAGGSFWQREWWTPTACLQNH
jgi:hypothetical protein